jgi:hypothetical protein
VLQADWQSSSCLLFCLDSFLSDFNIYSLMIKFHADLMRLFLGFLESAACSAGFGVEEVVALVTGADTSAGLTYY